MMSLALRGRVSSLSVLTLLAFAASLPGCITKELLGGGGGNDTTTTSEGGASQGGSAGAPQGGYSMGGSAGAPQGGFSMGGSAGAPEGGFSMGGSAGAPQGGASMGGSGGSGGAEPMPDGWARKFGDGVGFQEAFGVAASPNGDVVVTGTMEGTMPMDGVNLSASGGRDIFVAKLSPSGAVLWAKRFGNGDYQDGYSVAVDPSGAVLLAGGFFGTIDFGGGPLVSAGDEDLYVVKLDANGDHVWSKRFGDAGTQPRSPGCKIAADATGAVTVAGSYTGTLDFGAGPLPTGGSTEQDIFVARLDANGNVIYSHRYGDTEVGNQEGEKLRALSVDSAGNATISGSMTGTINFGGGALSAPIGSFAARLDANGNQVFGKVFGATTADLTALTLTSGGGVVLSGIFTGSIDFGGGPLSGLNGYGVLVKLNSAGQLVWAKQHGGQFRANGATTSEAGATTFAGYAFGAVNLTGLGGGILTPFDGSSSAVIVTLAADGTLAAAKNYSVPSMEIGPDRQLYGAAYDPSGYLFTVGSFQSTIDMGFGVLDAGSWPDVLVARLPASL